MPRTAKIKHIVKQTEIYNTQTGEVSREVNIRQELPDIEGYDIKYIPQKTRINNGPFITLFQEPLLELMRNCVLTKNEMCVLLFLIGIVDENNTVISNSTSIAKELNLKQSNTYTALQNLAKMQIIEIDKIDGRTQSIKLSSLTLNPNLAYKGPFKEFAEKRRKAKLLKQRDGITCLMPADEQRRQLQIEREKEISLFDFTDNQ